MIVYIASDHAGFDTKSQIINSLNDSEFEIVDLGPSNSESVDYPDYAHLMSQKMKQHHDSKGVLICGSGIGMSIAANRHSHIRAALCYTPEAVELARQHNDANILCLGARLTDEKTLYECVKTFFSTEFEGGRHQRRVDKMTPKEYS